MVAGCESAPGDKGGGLIEPGLPHRLDTNLFLGEFRTLVLSCLGCGANIRSLRIYVKRFYVFTTAAWLKGKLHGH